MICDIVCSLKSQYVCTSSDPADSLYMRDGIASGKRGNLLAASWINEGSLRGSPYKFPTPQYFGGSHPSSRLLRTNLQEFLCIDRSFSAAVFYSFSGNLVEAARCVRILR